MYKIKWYERLLIATILTVIAFLVCLTFKSDLWISFGIGSFGYQIFDFLFDYYKTKKIRK